MKPIARTSTLARVIAGATFPRNFLFAVRRLALSVGTVAVLTVSCGEAKPPFVDDGAGPTRLGSAGASCTTPNEGCPCLFHQEGLSMPCGAVASATGSEVECYHGLRTCKTGKWGICDPVGTSTSTKKLSIGLGLSPQGLGGSATCVGNPCDLYCQEYADTPTGLDAGPAFNVTPDGGLTLAPPASCAGLPNVDNDNDGWTELEGDCNDCSSVINPGAYDYPADGFDNDCDGTIDNAVTSCDAGLSLTTASGDDFARAIDLCRFTAAGATGAARTWGVINGSSKIVQANTTGAPAARQYGIMDFFGNVANNGAKKGANLAAFSSGSARYTGQTNFVTPKGWCGSYSAGTTSTVPCGLSWNKAGCPAGTAGRNSSGMSLQVRVPTNAQCMSFRFHFISSEYPEWVCTPYNDTFIAMLKSSAMVPGTGCCGTPPNTNCNISYGTGFTPVSVNNNLFFVPGCTTCTSPILSGTGFDGSCRGYIKGGSTNWLYSYAPVKPGETATFHTSIWDTGDQVWDSTVLIDSWDWYPGTCSIGTSPSPPSPSPPPPPAPFEPGTYSREFEAICPPGTRVVWRLFSWYADEPSDSKINFTVQTADTLGALTAAPSAFLATAQGAATPTWGSADVKPAIDGIPSIHKQWLRVNMGFVPSTDGLSAPTVYDWKQTYDCPPTE